MVGCLKTDMGQTLARKCIFIMKDKVSEGSHMGDEVLWILGMTIMNKLKMLLLPEEGTSRMSLPRYSEKNAVLSRVQLQAERHSYSLGSVG